MSVSGVENLKNIELFVVEKPEMLIKDSIEKEKSISVDPVSIKESGLPPTIPKLFSSSLPSSITSSPRSASKKLKNQNQQSLNSLSRQHSVALSRLAQLHESHLQRSKSLGEGRASAPSDDFDLWSTKPNNIRHESGHFVNSYRHETQMGGHKTGRESLDSYDEKFKCGALCLFLPGFGKGKPVRARKEEPEVGHVISRTVSLEKFECGSWTSSGIINDSGDGESSKLYFDLPLELIRSNTNDADSPVRAAFVFDKDRKGVLKNGGPRDMGRKSHESFRHVRFSTSSPASQSASASPCITPRLRKAREDFNAFLEAQSV